MITEHWLTTRMTIDKRTIGQWPILMYIHCTYETRQSCSKWSQCHAFFLSSEKLEVSTAGGVSRLEISSLRDSDAGEYVCQLSLLTGLLSLQHTLDVLGSHCPYNIFTYMQFLVGFYQYSLITLVSWHPVSWWPCANWSSWSSSAQISYFGKYCSFWSEGLKTPESQKYCCHVCIAD